MQIWEMGAIAIASNPNSEVLKDLADRQTGRRRGRLSLRALLPFMGLVIFWFLISRILRPSVFLISFLGILLCPAKREKVRRRLVFQAGNMVGGRARKALYKPICFMTPATRSPIAHLSSSFLDGICSSPSNSLRAAPDPDGQKHIFPRVFILLENWKKEGKRRDAADPPEAAFARAKLFWVFWQCEAFAMTPKSKPATGFNQFGGRNSLCICRSRETRFAGVNFLSHLTKRCSSSSAISSLS